MVSLTIDGVKVEAPDNSTVLDAARKANIDIPTLCYLKGVNALGACRICLVEVKNNPALQAACVLPVAEGMEVFTKSEKVLKARKVSLDLLLSNHDRECLTCVRNRNCELQTLAEEFGIRNIQYEGEKIHKDIDDKSVSVVRNPNKCVLCKRCIAACEKIQTVGVIGSTNRGFRTMVEPVWGKSLVDVPCINCGQCIVSCPVGALSEKSEIDQVWAALHNPNMHVVVQPAPAVRVALGEEFGMPMGTRVTGKLAAALRRMGFDKVFDTDFGADLTIMEEGSEFLERLAHKEDYAWPMFTSCCPGWVRFVKTQYPDMVKNLSTAKSPQQMFGAMSKTYIAQKLGIDPSKVFSLSIMPCVAKKYERSVPQVNDSGRGSDVDLVLTTRELDSFIRSDSIKPEDLTDVPFDSIFGEGSGAGVIFGTTGGVMEAALRSAYYMVAGKNPDADAFKNVRGNKGWREQTFNLKGNKLKVAVATGLANARELIEAIRAGEVQYDFVEVMACPGGCVGGGGQPFTDGVEMAEKRGDMLYDLDKASDIRFSHENSAVKLTYEEYLGEPLSKQAHHMLHTNIAEWDLAMLPEV